MKDYFILLIFCLSETIVRANGPIPVGISSVPWEGGNITIFGDQFAAIDKSSIKVTIGILNCNVKYSDNNKIICTLGPRSENIWEGYDLIVKVEVDKISTAADFKFTYKMPYIRGYSLSNDGKVTLVGELFLGYENWVYIIDGRMFYTPFSFGNGNTKWLFKSILSIYTPASNTIKIHPTLEPVAISNGTISIIGQTIYYELNGIFYTNIELTPMITILLNDSTLSINGTFLKINPYDSSSITYSFDIPKGCRKEILKFSIGDQSTSTFEINYEKPKITNCSIDNVIKSINCNGNFTNFNSYFIDNLLSFKFSNETIEAEEIQIQENNISFPLKSNYLTGDIQFNLCNIQSEPYRLFIPPIYKSGLNSSNKLNTTGGNIIINGSHFNENFTISTYFDCLIDGSSKRFNCKYISIDSISCNLEINGPIYKSCDFTFNNQLIVSPLLFIYYPPSISNVTTLINPIDGGNITIIGNEFYKQIDSISINEFNCINSIFINSTVIHCLIGPILNHKSSTIYNVTITINGKTATKSNINIFPFGDGYNESNNNSNSNSQSDIPESNNESNNNSISKINCAFVLFVCVNFFINLLICKY